jgi:hypothetical protein
LFVDCSLIHSLSCSLSSAQHSWQLSYRSYCWAAVGESDVFLCAILRSLLLGWFWFPIVQFPVCG